MDAEIEALVRAAAAGDELAWHRLWCALEARIRGLVRRYRVSADDDVLRDAVVAVMGRLRGRRFHGLRLYLTARIANPDLPFLRWLHVVARRVTIDGVRADPDYVDRRRSAPGGARHGLWITRHQLTDVPDHIRVAVADRLFAAQIMSRAPEVLSVAQQAALELWAQDRTSGDIARRLSLAGEVEAQRLVRAAIERLRRKYRR